MTEKQFGEKVVRLWRLRQKLDRAVRELKRRKVPMDHGHGYLSIGPFKSKREERLAMRYSSAACRLLGLATSLATVKQ